jgi:multidrug efflux system membrane fusion protein
MLLVNRHSFFHFIIIPLLLLALSLVGCKEKKIKDKEIIRSVKTLLVTPASSSGTRQLSGVVRPTDESDLSFQVGGTVETVEVKLGDSVKKGQLLAAIDPRDFELKLLSAQAARVSAKTNVTNAFEEFTRKKTLQEHDFASKAAYEKAKSLYEMAVSKEKIETSIEEERLRE